MKEKRFLEVYKESKLTAEIKVLVDRETGVNYLVYGGGYGSTIIPLLDENGKVKISDKYEYYEEARG